MNGLGAQTLIVCREVTCTSPPVDGGVSTTWGAVLVGGLQRGLSVTLEPDCGHCTGVLLSQV